MPTVASLTARIGADIGGLDAGLRVAEGKVKSFADRLNSAGTRLSVGLTAPLVALATASVRSATQMDSLKRGLTAVAGSAAEADRQLVRLREIAKLPGLGRVEAIQASTQLQAAGLSARTAEQSLLAFGNALATVGKGKAELAGVTTALTQITAKGKVTAEEINQIAERVPQIRVAMQQAFGTANTELLQKMGLTARQFIEGINQELLKLPRVTGGAQTAFENLSDVVGEALSEIGANILPTLLPIVERLTNRLVDLTRQFAALSPEVRRNILVVAGLVALAGPTLLFLGQFAAAVKSLGLAIPAVLTALRGVTAFLGGPWGIALAAAATVVVSNWDTISKTIATWANDVVPLLKGTWQNIQSDLAPAMDLLKSTVISAMDEISTRFQKDTGEWQTFFQRTGDAINQFVERNKGWIQAVAEFMGLAHGIPQSVGRAYNRAGQQLQEGRSLADEIFGDMSREPLQMAPIADGGGTGFRPTLPKKETEFDRQLKAQKALLNLNRQLGETFRNQLGPAEALANVQIAQGKNHQLWNDALRESISQFRLLPKALQEAAAASILEQRILEQGVQKRKELADAIRAEQVAQKQAAGAGPALAIRKQFEGWLFEGEADKFAGIKTATAESAGLQEIRKRLHDVSEEMRQLNAAGVTTGEVNRAAALSWEILRKNLVQLEPEERKLVNRLSLNIQTLEMRRREVAQTIQRNQEFTQSQYAIDDALYRGRRALDAFTAGTAESRFTWERFGQDFRDFLPTVQDQIRELMRLDQVMGALTTVAEGTKQIFLNAFSSIADGFGNFFSSIYQGFKNLLVQMAAEYLSSQIQGALMGLIGGFFTGKTTPAAGGGVSLGMRGGLSEAVAGAINPGKLTIPAMQHGGYLRAGQAALVGERGPELFIPSRSGRVMANGAMAGAGGQTVVVNMTVNTPDAMSFQRNRGAMMADLRAEIERASRRNG